MPVLNFKPQFVQPIKEGRKTHTIRAPRKRPVFVGDTLYLYTGLRRKGAELIRTVECVGVEEIEIVPGADLKTDLDPPLPLWIFIDGHMLAPDEAARFARSDGFADLAAFSAYWLPLGRFRGHVIHWKHPGPRTLMPHIWPPKCAS